MNTRSRFLRRRPKRRDGGDILGPGAAELFLAATDQQRPDRQIALRHQSTGAQDAAHLVGRQSQQIGAQIAHIKRNAAGSLRCVAMQQPAGCMNQIGCRAHRLDHAGLVIRQHDRDEGRPTGVTQRRGEIVEIHLAVALNPQNARARYLSRLQHRIMFDAGDDQRPFAPAGESQIIGLGPAGDEDHVLSLRANQPRDLSAGAIDQRARGTAEAMDRRRIADRAQRRFHRRLRGGAGRRGCVGIHVDRVAHFTRFKAGLIPLQPSCARDR